MSKTYWDKKTYNIRTFRTLLLKSTDFLLKWVFTFLYLIHLIVINIFNCMVCITEMIFEITIKRNIWNILKNILKREHKYMLVLKNSILLNVIYYSGMWKTFYWRFQGKISHILKDVIFKPFSKPYCQNSNHTSPLQDIFYHNKCTTEHRQNMHKQNEYILWHF